MRITECAEIFSFFIFSKLQNFKQMKNNLTLVFLLLLIGIIGCSTDNDSESPQEPVQEPVSEENTIEVLKTPLERFQGLPDYPWEPKYVTVMPYDLEMHYVEAGPADGQIVLLLHGNPNWGYGLRELIALFAENGYHVYAPDLIGFGKSDKPVWRSVHTYDNQEAWITSFVKALDLKEVYLHCQDWGGLIGLRVAIENPERFKSVAISNTDLPTGDNVSETFLNWQVFSQTVPTYSFTVQSATFAPLSNGELVAFDAPFPEESYKAGPRQLPLAVPTDPNVEDAQKNSVLWEKWEQWEKPFLTIFSVDDNISPDAEKRFQERIPGAQNQPHTLLPDTGHFIREDEPEMMFELLDAFFESGQ